MSDTQWNDESGEYEAFGSLGEYGVTSAELPTVSPEQWARWEREQQRVARAEREQAERARADLLDHLDDLYALGLLAGHGFDLLWAEIDLGRLPDLYRDAAGRWMVYSEHERRSWTLAGWNQHANELLPVESRETARLYLTPPATLPTYHARPVRPTPLVGLPEVTSGAARPWHARFDSRLPGTPPPTLRVTPPLWLTDAREDEER